MKGENTGSMCRRKEWEARETAGKNKRVTVIERGGGVKNVKRRECKKEKEREKLCGKSYRDEERREGRKEV